MRGKKGRRERRITLRIELVLDDDWRLRRAILSGKDLFLRSEEARRERELVASARVERRAAERFVALVTKRLLSRELICNGGSDDDGVTTLDCEGLQLMVRPGFGAEEDLVIIEPAPSRAPDAPPKPEPPPEQPPGEAEPPAGI